MSKGIPKYRETSDEKDNASVRSDYVKLRRIARKLIRVSDIVVKNEQEISVDTYPYYYLLVGVFLQAQIHYLEDILQLSPNRTVELLSRTMIEGYIKLKWVEEEPGSRSERWATFIYFQEWKTIVREESRGVNHNGEKTMVLEKLKEFAHYHLNDSGKSSIAQGVEINTFGDIKNDWTGKSIFDLVKGKKTRELYSRFFDPQNDWVHWSPKGMLKIAKSLIPGVEVTFQSYYLSTASIIGGISSLLGCLRIWNHALGISPTKDQLEIENEFLPWDPEK